MRVIEVNSFEELTAKEKEVLDLGFRFYNIVDDFVIYFKSCHEIRIKCNFWQCKEG